MDLKKSLAVLIFISLFVILCVNAETLTGNFDTPSGLTSVSYGPNDAGGNNV